MFYKLLKKILPEKIIYFFEQQYRKVKFRKVLFMSGMGNGIIGDCKFEGKIFVGGNVQFIDTTVGWCTYFCGNNVVNMCEIGRFCSIARGVQIGLEKHPTEGFVSTSPFFYCSKEVFGGNGYSDTKQFEDRTTTYIGNDVWIGVNALIKGGVRIGDGAIIGAGAVVTKDVAPYAIVVGVPARLIKYRFAEKEIEELLQCRWWDKPESWIQENQKKFLNIKTFL